MVDTDWREILSFSQKELLQTDKEKLCENLSWMDVDDVELNFSDMKTLFKLSQDILKHKSEQVNNLLGRLETSQKKTKRRTKGRHSTAPAESNESSIVFIANQEEEIKANKEILKQLQNDIAELVGQKSKLEENKYNLEKDSDSSPDALSEMQTVVELENEIAMKNKHIRKLLGDLKVVEEENSKLKEKITTLKDKLMEATQLINNLTEQIVSIKEESSQLKDVIGKLEHEKIQLSIIAEELRKQLIEKESNRENIYEEIKSKAQQWKCLAKSKKAEAESLLAENNKLKEDLKKVGTPSSSPKKTERVKTHETKIKELQEKLTDAAKEIDQSANLIVALKTENKHLKSFIEELQDHSISDIKNQSDDNKERIIIIKLKKKIKSLVSSLQAAEEMIADREEELAGVVSQLQNLQSDEGIDALVQDLKNKTRQLRVKDQGIKNLVVDVNSLYVHIEELQLQNETLRQKCNLGPGELISTKEIRNKYDDIANKNKQMILEIRKLQDQVIKLELDNRNIRTQMNEKKKLLNEYGYNESINKNTIDTKDNQEISTNDMMPFPKKMTEQSKTEENIVKEKEVTALIEENEGLRKGLREILDFLKDNSTTSSGILSLQCPSLEKVLHSMEARHTSGWFSPHMTTVMELKSAQGEKDALFAALHEARKKTFEVMRELAQEVQKSSELQEKLKDMENQTTLKDDDLDKLSNIDDICEFGSWISDNEIENIDLQDKIQIESFISKGNDLHEKQLIKGLQYFHNKFKLLYNNITSITIKALDDKNNYNVQEENYKAEIANLKAQIDDEEFSDKSPGLLSNINTGEIQRKCLYLEESYKYIRTLNENMKQEYIQNKKEALLGVIEYECQIQRLILAVASLTNKLRSSIPSAYFWKQNEEFNEITLKYRKCLEKDMAHKEQYPKLIECFESNKIDIISTLESRIAQNGEISIEGIKQAIENIFETKFQNQIDEFFTQLDAQNDKINKLEEQNKILQSNQSKLIDDVLSSATKKEINLMEEQIHKLSEDKIKLKEQYQHVSSQLEITLIQLQDNQQQQLKQDIEINMLRHQILDLQSISDNKAIIARLGGEILVAHLQASESYQKIEELNVALNKEKQRRTEAEDMLESREKIFDIHTFKYESKFKYMHEIMQILRNQYQGSLPLISVENYLNSMEDMNRKTLVIEEKLTEVEDLRFNLMAKHSTFDQILGVTRNKCSLDEDDCPHSLKYKMMESMHSREMEYAKNKLIILENMRLDLIKQCNHIERNIVLLNQAFDKSSTSKNISNHDTYNVKLEDINSDEEQYSRKSATIILPKPQILNNRQDAEIRYKNNSTQISKVDTATNKLIDCPIKTQLNTQQVKFSDVEIQTTTVGNYNINQFVQTETDEEIIQLKSSLNRVQSEYDKINKELDEAVILLEQKGKETRLLSTENSSLQTKIKDLKTTYSEKDTIIGSLQSTVETLKIDLNNIRGKEAAEKFISENFDENTKSLVLTLKQLEAEKNRISLECKELLNNEREEYSKSLKSLNIKIMELQSKLDRKGSDANASNAEAFKEIIGKYTVKIAELEDNCFKIQSELDECKAALKMYQSETDRWRDLAAERLTKMEQLNSQLEKRHCHEVESYKAENQHWLSQLSETQREHMDLRTRLTEQKAAYMKQLAEKDSHIEQLRTVIHNLKTQNMNMQTMLSASDPGFDLSAIVEVDEGSDGSPQGSDRLELKFDTSSQDLFDSQVDFLKISGSSTVIWQEPIIERLRRDKQLTGKQNAILRRQIKALAARERRARLDAQNLKNQLFRISTMGNKVATAETAALHNKIASLQAQLMNIRRDSQSSVALWDKWKRAQQASERWQARYEDKCQEVKKLESSLNLAKSGITRLEKEKRVLMSRLTEIKSESYSTLEKQEAEPLEKKEIVTKVCSCNSSPVSSEALLERVKSQQRRIVALEAAEKGNEHLVSEYEKSLAEITSLKGQVLKLESTLLESQIKSPFKADKDTQPEIDYWKSYCEMLKEENVQLTLKLNSLESTPTTTHQQRINDLEQTVLMLRGLVSKLQAEQKVSGSHKRSDSRPGSGRAASEKNVSQLESHRIEIANLKRSLQDKNLLLERSKEMLKIAAEREDDLLRENALLRRRIEMLSETSGGFMSA